MRRLLALALLTGCAMHPAPPAKDADKAANLGNDALEMHFRALAIGLRDDGLKQDEGALLERGFLPPSGRFAYPVHIAAGECAMFVALATASMADLDASLYTAEGAALIEDDSTGSRPTLTFCAGADGAIDAYFTLHAYQGAGAFVAAQFTRPSRAEDDLRTGSEQGVSALGELAQTLHDRGFEDAAPRVNLPLGDQRPVRMAVNVAAGECYTLAAEGGEGLAELGLRLVDSDGGELALGLGEAQSGRPQLAALQYCADHRAELALEVVARRGHGLAKVARFRATQALVGGVRALWLGEPSPSEQAWQGKPEPTPRAKSKNDERVPLRQGQVIELAPRAPIASCERWRIELAPGLSRATLRIEDARGELLNEADSQHMQACVDVCAAGTQRRASVVGRTGFGVLNLHVEPRSAPQSDCAPCPAEAARACSLSSGRR